MSTSTSMIVRGVLAVVIGVVSVIWPGLTALFLTIWMAAWALVTGAGEVVTAFQRGESVGERVLWVSPG